MAVVAAARVMLPALPSPTMSTVAAAMLGISPPRTSIVLEAVASTTPRVAL